jgi:hypothetical protein
MLNNKEIDNMRILGVKHYYSSSTIAGSSFTFSAPASGKTSLVEINYTFAREYIDSALVSNKIGYILGNGKYEGYMDGSSKFTVTVSGNNLSFTDYSTTFNHTSDLQFIVYEVET